MDSVFHRTSATFVSTPMEGLSWQEAYALLTAVVAPRPIALVSTVSIEGVPNLAPFSFFNVGGSNPPSLVFSPVLGSGGREKDTLRNARETGEFVVNLVHRAMAEDMNRASAKLPPTQSELDETEFTTLPSSRVRPFRIAESRVQLECRTHQVVEHGDGPGAARYVIGEVLLVHVSRTALENEKIDPNALEPIGRLGGSEYVDTGRLEKFELDRPK